MTDNDTLAEEVQDSMTDEKSLHERLFGIPEPKRDMRRLTDEKAEHPEDFAPVIRNPDSVFMAAPVDRQEERSEGTIVESDEWLIREPGGESYIVDDETFESEFEYANSYYVIRLNIALPFDFASPDRLFVSVDNAHNLVVDALVYSPTQSVEWMNVVSFENNTPRRENVIDSLPMEVIHDNPFITQMGLDEEEDDENEEDER